MTIIKKPTVTQVERSQSNSQIWHLSNKKITENPSQQCDPTVYEDKQKRGTNMIVQRLIAARQSLLEWTGAHQLYGNRLLVCCVVQSSKTWSITMDPTNII